MDFVTFLSQLYGKDEETAHKLRCAGYTTAQKVCSTTPEKLSRIAGLSVFSAKGMIKTARGMLQQDREERKGRLVEIEGIGDRRAKKLRKAGLGSVKAVALTKEDKLAKVLQVPKSTAGKIIKSAKNLGSYVPSAGMTSEETAVLTNQVLPQETRTKEELKTAEQWVKSFWKFG